jgi:hypothetical protein
VKKTLFYLYLGLVSFILLPLMFANEADADIFYSLDKVSRSLVTVNTSTGTVSSIGPLGITYDYTIGLAAINQNTLMTIVQTASPFVHAFYTINTQTGAATYLTDIPYPTILGAEYLVRNPQTGEVYISYGTTWSGNQLGVVNTTNGAITHLATFGNIDMDELAFNASGQLYAADGFPGALDIFYSLNIATQSCPIVGQLTLPNIAEHSLEGLAFLQNNSLSGVQANYLYNNIDMAAGTIGQTFNTGNYLLYGLSPVPLPPTVFLFGSGLLGLAGWRRFRKS